MLQSRSEASGSPGRNVISGWLPDGSVARRRLPACQVNTLGESLQLLSEERHHVHDLPAEKRVHHANVLDRELTSHDKPLELVAAADAYELVLVPAQEDEAAQFPPCGARRTDSKLSISPCCWRRELYSKTSLNPSIACRSRPRTGAPKPMKSPKSAICHSFA